ncbi:unnamed protein product, partial [Dibothriocephalus latus]
MDVVPSSDASPATPSSNEATNEEETPMESSPDPSLDGKSEPLQSFIRIDMVVAFEKIFQEPVGYSWENAIHHGIYLNALLAVEMCAITADKDIPEILELESIVFDPKAVFHMNSVRDSAVLHSIQMGKSEDAFDNFPQIVSVLPHLGADPEEAAEEPDAESTDSASDSSVLLVYAGSPESKTL